MVAQATLTGAFGALPTQLRDELLAAFNQILRNYRERRWEPAELNGGKLCEVVYSILKGHAAGTYPSRAKKPRNMVLACQNLENELAGAPRSIRIQIPRMLIALYEIRNNRNVGHVGGDVEPNHMDAVCVLQIGKWIMAELVRVLHAVDVGEATALVEGLVERDTPQPVDRLCPPRVPHFLQEVILCSDPPEKRTAVTIAQVDTTASGSAIYLRAPHIRSVKGCGVKVCASQIRPVQSCSRVKCAKWGQWGC